MFILKMTNAYSNEVNLRSEVLINNRGMTERCSKLKWDVAGCIWLPVKMVINTLQIFNVCQV